MCEMSVSAGWTRQRERVYARAVVLLRSGEVNRIAGRLCDVLQRRTSGNNCGGGIAVPQGCRRPGGRAEQSAKCHSEAKSCVATSLHYRIRQVHTTPTPTSVQHDQLNRTSARTDVSASSCGVLLYCVRDCALHVRHSLFRLEYAFPTKRERSLLLIRKSRRVNF